MTAVAAISRYTPMAKIRHDCRNGCYLVNLHAPIHFFDDCFGGNIEMMDIDGVVERNGHFLLLEWKTNGGTLHQGQRILLSKFTEKGKKFLAVVVFGPVNPTSITELQIIPYVLGEAKPAETVTLEQLQAKVRKWYEWADSRAQA